MKGWGLGSDNVIRGCEEHGVLNNIPARQRMLTRVFRPASIAYQLEPATAYNKTNHKVGICTWEMMLSGMMLSGPAKERRRSDNILRRAAMPGQQCNSLIVW